MTNIVDKNFHIEVSLLIENGRYYVQIGAIFMAPRYDILLMRRRQLKQSYIWVTFGYKFTSNEGYERILILSFRPLGVQEKAVQVWLCLAMEI